MIVLGIDPGYAIVGWGVIKSEDGHVVHIDHGAIETSKDLPTEQRLKLISNGLKELIKQYQPEVVGIETIWFKQNKTTGIVVAEARGVILETIASAGLKIVEVKPAEVKQAIAGSGNADKAQMQFMVKTILKLKEIPKPDDAADALAIAVTTEQKYRFTSYTSGG